MQLDELQSLKDSKKEANIFGSKAINVYENGTDNEKQRHTGLVLTGLSASWDADAIVNTLRDINLTAFPGEFVGIAGLVGSGKVNIIKCYT